MSSRLMMLGNKFFAHQAKTNRTMTTWLKKFKREMAETRPEIIKKGNSDTIVIKTQ